MKTKNPSNGHSYESDTVLEDPQAGSTNTTVSITDKAEIESVPGFTMYNSAEAAQESKPMDNGNNEAAQENTYEEIGYESATETEGAKDAYFSSYPSLTPDGDRKEVIIGVDNRIRIHATTSFPWRAICALRITAQDNSTWFGTGWLVGPRTVITAGHCVYLHGNGGWAKRIEVIPGLNDSSRPYRSCFSSNIRSVRGWSVEKRRDYDYGAIILPADCRYGDRVGYFGYAVRNDAYLLANVVNMSGYPGDKGTPPESNRANQQWFMALRPKSVSAKVITYDIDSMGGQSGGPVWVKVGDNRYVVGIHTNGHSTGNSATRIDQSVFNNIKNWKAQGA